MSITRHFKLGLNAGASLPLLIHANQYDHGEEWAFTLYNQDGSRYTPSSGSIIGIKSDNLGISVPGRIESGDVIITESQQMTAAAGKAVFELLIDGETHGTANFVVLVEPRPGDGAVVSASDYSLFQEAINSIAIAGSGAPAVVTLASGMTDEGKVYLYAGSETGYTNGHWYYYNGSAWTDGGLYGGTVDATLTMSGVAADAKKTGDEISDLKSDFNLKVDLNGENQITPQNIAGMQFTKTTGEVEGENAFDSEMLFREGQYVQVASGGIVGVGTNANYNSYCIPVEQNTKYKFTASRFVVLATGNTIGSPAIGTTQSNLSEVETGSATYMFLSINVDSISNIYVKPVTVNAVYSDFILPDWLVDNLPIPTVVEKPKFATVTGNIASGGNLQLTSPKNNLRKGERIVFEGNISSFESIRIGLSFSTDVGTDSNQINTFRIDTANISYYARSTSTPVTVAHGLTIANNIQIIWEMSAEASVKLTLISNGNMFAHVFTNFARQAIGNPFVLSVGSVLSDCKLTWTCADIDKDIWMFGDSYFMYSNQRWTYYLHQYGYDQNCLLDGYSGMGGTNGRVSFNNLLQYGTPKIAVWCLGMNDTSDSDSAPATNWVSARDYFLQYCTNNGITPVFGTIPTVPTINHEQKNAWIRSSGYRYIDFAKAVGASASGVWYGDMLSSDGVHPSESGAKALFAQVLIDLPEIMLNDFGY